MNIGELAKQSGLHIAYPLMKLKADQPGGRQANGYRRYALKPCRRCN